MLFMPLDIYWSMEECGYSILTTKQKYFRPRLQISNNDEQNHILHLFLHSQLFTDLILLLLLLLLVI